MIREAMLAAALILPALECAGAETTMFPRLRPGTERLVIYSSTDLETLRSAIADFQSMSPEIEVEYVDLDTNELYRRYLDEVEAGLPPGDLLISSSMDLQVKLVNDGYAATYASSETDSIPDWAKWRDQAFGFTFEPVVMVYNRDLVPADLVPRTRFDLLRLLREDATSYRGRIATYDVEQSGVGYLLASQDSVVGSTFWSLAETFGQNAAALTPFTSDILQGVTEGRFLFGYNVLGAYAQAWTERHPAIGIVQPGDYTLAISRTAVLSADARNPEEARRFLDYLLSLRGQQVLAEQGRLFAVRPELTGPYSRVGISENSAGPLRLIPLGPGLLVHLDRLKREKFLETWRGAMRRAVGHATGGR